MTHTPPLDPRTRRANRRLALLLGALALAFYLAMLLLNPS